MPTAEDWENACHEVIWKRNPALFEEVQRQVARECVLRLDPRQRPETKAN